MDPPFSSDQRAMAPRLAKIDIRRILAAERQLGRL
jgi:hypothetical protein